MFNSNITAKYLNNPQNCPFCDSTFMASEVGIMTDDKTFTKGVECLSCRKKWKDVFKLFSIEKSRKKII